jgi:hypothetical protein
MSRSFFRTVEFNDFLFAPIGEENNGMQLSVLTALARRGIDPWEEAARLARLSKELARENLSAFIAGVTNGRWAPSDSCAIAARLVQLLPSRATSDDARGSVNGNATRIVARWW